MGETGHVAVAAETKGIGTTKLLFALKRLGQFALMFFHQHSLALKKEVKEIKISLLSKQQMPSINKSEICHSLPTALTQTDT
jgi:hypothetical protein